MVWKEEPFADQKCGSFVELPNGPTSRPFEVRSGRRFKR